MRQTARRGQVLVIFALALIPILGFVGLAIDGGNAFVQRGLVQNGADAAVLAALREIARLNPTAAGDRINEYARRNAGPNATVDWSFIDNLDNVASNPSDATGVRVTVGLTFPTLFMGILNIPTASVSATARGRVQALNGFGGDPPFLVCENPLQWVPPVSTYAAGLLLPTTPPTINPAAVGQTFIIHWSQLGQSGGACGYAGSQFKGNADGDWGGCPTLPCWGPWQPGTRAGPTRNRVAGYPGCSDSNDLSDCVLILPIVVQSSNASVACAALPPPGNDMCVVVWGAFLVTTPGSPRPPGCTPANCHYGRLLGDVTVLEGTGSDWTPASVQPKVIRLSA